MASAQIPVVISYHKPGTRPPLYVAGTFSEPPWQPFEMDYITREDGEYDFRKEIHADPGAKIQYKFRLGGGDWWVLKDDGPMVTDSSGNTNHVLEVKPQNEQSAAPESAGRQQDTGKGAPMSYAKVTAKRLQTPEEASASDRSGTGTPIFARIAAEVADSAELLHEEVPDREKPAAAASSTKAQEPTSGLMSNTAETAAEVADTAEMLDNSQTSFVILEPPPGEGHPFKVQPLGDEFGDDQEGYIADKSPLFAHECAGMYNPEETGEVDFGEEEEEEEEAYPAAAVEDIDYDKVDLNDPTLERFPSNREEIMDAVRKLETGLEADQASFDGNARSPVVNPSRRGTEDITGDFLLTAPQATSPTQRALKKSPRGSISSIPAASLHSISEAEESGLEDDFHPQPAVVFSNPLKPKPKPKHLRIPTSEDEGVALPDGISPRTVKPNKRIATPEASPPHSPPSPKTVRKAPIPASESVAPAEYELAKHKERSMQAVKIHPPTSVQETAKHPAAPAPGESKQAPHPSPVRRLSYAEVAAAPPPPPSGPAQKDISGPTRQHPEGGELRRRQPGSEQQQQHHQQQQTTSTQEEPREGERQAAASKKPDSAGPSSRTPASVQPKKGGGWMRALVRLIFVDFVGGIFRRMFGWVWRIGWRRGAAEGRRDSGSGRD
ncbi:hypothetical protein VTI74DRAFT_9854 [Chaetomium olivicolor]